MEPGHPIPTHSFLSARGKAGAKPERFYILPKLSVIFTFLKNSSPFPEFSSTFYQFLSSYLNFKRPAALQLRPLLSLTFLYIFQVDSLHILGRQFSFQCIIQPISPNKPTQSPIKPTQSPIKPNQALLSILRIQLSPLRTQIRPLRAQISPFKPY